MPANIRLPEIILSRITPVSDLLVIRRAVANWPELLLFRFGLKKDVVIILRSQRKRIRIRNAEDYFYFLHGSKDWAIELAKQMKSRIKIGKNLLKIKAFGKDNLFYFSSKQELGTAARLAIEEFVWCVYGKLDVKDKIVLDIGACIGDASIYFAGMGADHIYSLEPFPLSYKIAKRNIKINNMDKKITLINAGVSDKEGFIRIAENAKLGDKLPLKDISYMIHLNDAMSTKGKKLRLISLSKLVEMYNIKNAVLKLDIEGDEYKVILSSSKAVLRSFSEIGIEYHNGYLDIEKRLRWAGFEVTHTLPRYAGYNDYNYGTTYSGLLYAKRI